MLDLISSIFASGSFLASSPIYRFERSIKSHRAHEHPSQCQQIVNPILNRQHTENGIIRGAL